MVDNCLYIFGGFSRDLFGDMRVYELNTGQWRIIVPQHQKAPEARFCHTMLQYGRKLIVFGGAGSYLQSIKMRLSYNDVSIFDTDNEVWLNPPLIEGAPNKRTSHSANIFGGLMLVHGGYNTEQKKMQDDFALFDLEKLKWTILKVYITSDTDDYIHRIDDQQLNYDNVP